MFFAGPPGQATHSSNKAVVFKKISFFISAKTAVLFSGIRLSHLRQSHGCRGLGPFVLQLTLSGASGREMRNQPW